jgi:hypothetical protein
MEDILVDFSDTVRAIPDQEPDAPLDNLDGDNVEVVMSNAHSLVMRVRQNQHVSPSETLFDQDRYDKLFDEETTTRYRAYRFKRQDPVTFTDMDDESSFKFRYVWNCMTGERIGIDPYGPLYFSPVTILRTIISKILLGLWTEFDNCVPMYGENVGVGKNFEIQGRGAQLEKYAFRLPIQDCYLYRDSDKFGKSVHTLGPELTDEELQEITDLIMNYWEDYPEIEDLPETALDILQLRKLYDVALNPKPTHNIEGLPTALRERYLRTLTTGNIDIDHNEFINRIAVDEIKNRIGFRSKAYF